VLERLIPLIEEVLSAGGVEAPLAAPEQIGPAIPLAPGIGDAGHRR
jgi:CRISPR-associated protein Cas1